MATVTLYATSKSGYGHARGTWSFCRTTSSANQAFSNLPANANGPLSSYQSWLGNWGMTRLHLVFDTSSIASGVEISSITMNLQKITSDGNTRSIHVVSSTKSPTADTVAGDYSLVGSTSYGSVNSTSNGPKSISLDSNGISYFTKGSYTVYGLREGLDLNDSQTNNYDENMSIGGPSNATESYRPNIVVTYENPTTFSVAFPTLPKLRIRG